MKREVYYHQQQSYQWKRKAKFLEEISKHASAEVDTLKKERKFMRDKDLKEKEEQASKLQSDQYNFT